MLKSSKKTLHFVMVCTTASSSSLIVLYHHLCMVILHLVILLVQGSVHQVTSAGGLYVGIVMPRKDRTGGIVRNNNASSW